MKKINIIKSGLGVRGVRLLFGMRAHAPSAFNQCVAGKLKGQSHPPAPLGVGGKLNVGWRDQFVEAVRKCKEELGTPRVRERITPYPKGYTPPPGAPPVKPRKPAPGT